MDEILIRLRDIRLILFDLEGVLLFKDDLENESRMNRIIFHLNKFCSKAGKQNIIVAILTARPEDDLTKYLIDSGVNDVLTSSIDKVTLSKKLLEKYNLDYSSAFYIGDDILDIPLLQKVGVSAAPMSARREVKRVVDYVTKGSNLEEILEEIWDLFRISRMY